MTATDPPRVRRAVLPAAGRGTRMRTLAGGCAKELLPVGGVPMLFHGVIDLIRSGIRDIAVVITPGKRAIREALTSQRVAPDAADALAPWWPHIANCTWHFPEQPEPRGLAHAVACAAPFLGEEPFVCYLPDNILTDGPPAAAQVVQAFQATGACTAAMVRVAPETAGGFGNCGALEFTPHSAAGSSTTVAITRLGDKGPGAFTDATGTGWRTCGVSVLTPEFLKINATLEANAQGEWDDVPILQHLARAGRLTGRLLTNTCYDVGNPAGYAAATEADVHLPAPGEPCRV